MEELLRTFPELPLLVLVLLAAILVRRVRLLLGLLAVLLVGAIVLGVFAHELLAALTGQPP